MIEDLKKVKGGFEGEDGRFHFDKCSYLMHMLGFCSCGVPEDILRYILTQLENIAALRKAAEHKIYYRQSIEAEFFRYWADSRGLTTHGGSVLSSWLTEKGRELMRDIEIVLKKEIKLKRFHPAKVIKASDARAFDK